MSTVSQQGPGKRAGSRRGKPRKTRIDPAILLLSLSITVLVVAWGYLVKAAIDFGSSGRDGDGAAWIFMLVACVGAAGCLFIGLILVGKLLVLIGFVPDAEAGPAEPPAKPVGPQPRSADAPRVTPSLPEGEEGPRLPNPRYPGGKRAAR